jgi:hypothetical protein
MTRSCVSWHCASRPDRPVRSHIPAPQPPQHRTLRERAVENRRRELRSRWAGRGSPGFLERRARGDQAHDRARRRGGRGDPVRRRARASPRLASPRRGAAPRRATLLPLQDRGRGDRDCSQHPPAGSGARGRVARRSSTRPSAQTCNALWRRSRSAACQRASRHPAQVAKHEHGRMGRQRASRPSAPDAKHEHGRVRTALACLHDHVGFAPAGVRVGGAVIRCRRRGRLAAHELAFTALGRVAGGELHPPAPTDPVMRNSA